MPCFARGRVWAVTAVVFLAAGVLAASGVASAAPASPSARLGAVRAWLGPGGLTVRTVVNRVLANRWPGEIVLMHFTVNVDDHSTPDADALPTVIKKLRFGAMGCGSDAGKLPTGVTAVGIAADRATGGYWILQTAGGADKFHAPRYGSLAGKIPAGSAVTAIDGQ